MTDVKLSDRTRRLIEAEIASGGYADPDEVVRAGIEALLERRASLDALHREVEVGLRDLRDGRVRAFEPRAFEPRLR